MILLLYPRSVVPRSVDIVRALCCMVETVNVFHVMLLLLRKEVLSGWCFFLWHPCSVVGDVPSIRSRLLGTGNDLPVRSTRTNNVIIRKGQNTMFFSHQQHHKNKVRPLQLTPKVTFAAEYTEISRNVVPLFGSPFASSLVADGTILSSTEAALSSSTVTPWAWHTYTTTSRASRRKIMAVTTTSTEHILWWSVRFYAWPFSPRFDVKLNRPPSSFSSSSSQLRSALIDAGIVSF